jgi:hypothetical protein
VKTLEGAADGVLTALSAATERNKTEKARLTAAAAAPKTLSEEEFLKAAPPAIRTLIETHEAEKATRTAALVESLKTAQEAYSEDELRTMNLETLEKLARVAQVVEVDFSGKGTPRSAAKGDDVFSNPPNPYEKALEARRQQAS